MAIGLPQLNTPQTPQAPAEQPATDWFAQFNPANQSPNTGVNGGNVAGGAQATDSQMTGTPAPANPVPAGQGNPAGFQAAWFASGGKTVDDLKAFVAAHPEFGATIVGSKGSKLTFPNGQSFQAVRSAGMGGGIGPAWDDLSSGGGGSAPTNIGYGQFTAPFVPPTAEDALNSPGLKFGLEEANRMMQNSAAAKGTLLNGRFQQALGAANVQNALQGYQGVYDRAYQTQTRNQDAPFSKNIQLAELGKPT